MARIRLELSNISGQNDVSVRLAARSHGHHAHPLMLGLIPELAGRWPTEGVGSGKLVRQQVRN